MLEDIIPDEFGRRGVMKTSQNCRSPSFVLGLRKRQMFMNLSMSEMDYEIACQIERKRF